MSIRTARVRPQWVTRAATNGKFGLEIALTSQQSGYFCQESHFRVRKRKILCKNPLEGLFGKSSLEGGLFGKSSLGEGLFVKNNCYLAIFGKGLFGFGQGLFGFGQGLFGFGQGLFGQGLFGQGLFGLISH